MQLGQRTHGCTLKKRIHQPIGQCFEAIAAIGKRRGLQFGASDTRMGCKRAHAAVLLPQSSVQLEGKHHIGQFALAVGAIAVIARAPTGIVPADAAEVLGARGHRHHPWIGTLRHQRQQLLSEGHVAEVIHPELQLMPLRSEVARGCHDPRIVEQ